MEKFLWNLGGFILFLANLWAIMLCFATGGKIFAVAMIVLAGLDWLYKEKRPTWIEV